MVGNKLQVRLVQVLANAMLLFAVVVNLSGPKEPLAPEQAWSG